MKFEPQPRHRRSIRLKGYDYTSPGAYFITIDTEQRECLFGSIDAAVLHLNALGRVALSEWERLPGRFRYISLDAFIIMPNHVHGIIILSGRGTAGELNDQDPDTHRRAPTEQFGKPVPGSIPTIIRSYKSAVAAQINRLRGTSGAPIWQRNYYEHIIRNQAEWERIRLYIQNNPATWSADRENPSRQR
jgi:REP element-mobilizing transposase RayT